MMKNKTIRTNVIFWSCYFLYEWLANAVYDSQYKQHLLAAALYLPLMFGATMFTVYVLINKYFFTGQKTRFWTGLIISMLVFGIAKRCVNFFIIYRLFSPTWMTGPPVLFPPKILFEMVSIYLIVALYAMFWFTQAWYEQHRLTERLQKDKVEAQLELLKSQVQPHFIFNTLNNIYSLSTQNSPKTSDLIYRLSSLLSYALYDSRKPMIPLEQEVEYIRNYIELEKIRYGDRLDIAVNVLNDTSYIAIPPFLLLPLVENCFKHGVSNEIDTCWIRLDILQKDGWLIIKVENSKTSNGQTNGTRNGIGLENVKQRLEILYPGRHELKCMSEEQSYLVVLKIKTMLHEDKVPAGR
jgi:two-component system LytT family sensor kinase